MSLDSVALFYRQLCKKKEQEREEKPEPKKK
jgi:hypothetical protein